MNFSTHKQQIIDAIVIALTKDKPDIISRFKIILGKCRSLLKSECYDFWLKQLGSIPNSEIPITKFGRTRAISLIPCLKKMDRNSFNFSILHICEILFTYSHVDDLCPFQTEYHYYFYLPDRKVFRESEMGHSELENKNILPEDIRIAKISELTADLSEYI